MKVEVQDYQADWKRQFEAEAQMLRMILGDELINIHHIGSTSVQGLKAKPIIDMMPIVQNIENVDFYNKPLEDIGYESLGEYGIPGRRYFRKGSIRRTQQLHIFQKGDAQNIDRHLAVRDYLRTHPEKAIQYGSLKETLAKKFPTDIQSYVNGKNDFVKKMEQQALVWYKTHEK